jgi:hypothetical protein
MFCDMDTRNHPEKEAFQLLLSFGRTLLDISGSWHLPIEPDGEVRN